MLRVASSSVFQFGIRSDICANPLNWGRNVDTMIGSAVNGNGTPYYIKLIGSAYIESSPLPIK